MFENLLANGDRDDAIELSDREILQFWSCAGALLYPNVI
jgi:hypothetical protein